MWRCGILLVIPQSGVSVFGPGDVLIILLFVFFLLLIPLAIPIYANFLVLGGGWILNI